MSSRGGRPGKGPAQDDRDVQAADELLAEQGVGSAAAQEEAPGEAGQAVPGVEGDTGSMLH